MLVTTSTVTGSASGQQQTGSGTKTKTKSRKRDYTPRTDEDFQFMTGAVFGKSKADSYRQAYDKDDSGNASRINDKMVDTDVGQAFLRGVQVGLDGSGIITAKGTLQGISAIAAGTVKDRFGFEVDARTRLSALEDMAKYHKLLTDSIEVKADFDLASAIGRARARAQAQAGAPTQADAYVYAGTGVDAPAGVQEPPHPRAPVRTEEELYSNEPIEIGEGKKQ